MIITRTPYRVSLFGGGTDYPCWFKDHGGVVLGFAINHYCWIAVRPRSPFGPRYKVIYSQVEECESIDEIRHPAVQACLRHLDIDGCEIYHTSDLPARSGTGSSSAFVVGLLNALYGLKRRTNPLYGANQRDLAEGAIFVERDVLKETVGCQDQYLCAYGGVKLLRFSSDKVVVEEIDSPNQCYPDDLDLAIDRMMQYLMLFYTGIQRTSSDITGTYVNELVKHDGFMRRIQDMPDLAIGMLDSWNPYMAQQFGGMLAESWLLKKGLGEGISTPEIDRMYSKALQAGAWGGKLLGGGGGGFFLLCVPPECRPSVRAALTDYMEVNFDLDRHGSEVVCDAK